MKLPTRFKMLWSADDEQYTCTAINDEQYEVAWDGGESVENKEYLVRAILSEEAKIVHIYFDEEDRVDCVGLEDVI